MTETHSPSVDAPNPVGSQPLSEGQPGALSPFVTGSDMYANAPNASRSGPLWNPETAPETQPHASPPAPGSVPSTAHVGASTDALAAATHGRHTASESTLDPTEVSRLVNAAVANQFEVTDAWKPKGKVQFIIHCPSGQRCLATHLDPLDLIEAGIAEEIDFFSKKLFPDSLDPAGNPVDEERQPGSVWVVLRDVQKRSRFLKLMNKLCTQALNKPGVVDDGVEVGTDPETGKKVLVYGATATPNQLAQLFPAGVSELKPGQVYASSIDFQDKMAIFDELNKPLELITPFRESPVGVSGVEPIQGPRGET